MNAPKAPGTSATEPIHPEQQMPESDQRIDKEASQAIKRIETQMRLDGKLDKAVAVEGAAYLLLPVILLVLFVITWLLKLVGIDGAARVVLTVAAFFLLCGVGFYAAGKSNT